MAPAEGKAAHVAERLLPDVSATEIKHYKYRKENEKETTSMSLWGLSELQALPPTRSYQGCWLLRRSFSSDLDGVTGRGPKNPVRTGGLGARQRSATCLARG